MGYILDFELKLGDIVKQSKCPTGLREGALWEWSNSVAMDNLGVVIGVSSSGATYDEVRIKWFKAHMGPTDVFVWHGVKGLKLYDKGSTK